MKYLIDIASNKRHRGYKVENTEYTDFDHEFVQLASVHGLTLDDPTELDQADEAGGKEGQP